MKRHMCSHVSARRLQTKHSTTTKCFVLASCTPIAPGPFIIIYMAPVMGLSLETTEALTSKPTWQARREYAPVVADAPVAATLDEEKALASAVAVVAPAPPCPPSSRVAAGTGWKLASAGFYVASDSCTKLLIARGLSAAATLAVRSAFFVLVASARVRRETPRDRSGGGDDDRRVLGRWLAARAIIAAAAALAVFFAIARLALGDALALVWINPVLASALGALVLGERASRAELVGLLLSAAGASCRVMSCHVVSCRVASRLSCRVASRRIASHCASESEGEGARCAPLIAPLSAGWSCFAALGDRRAAARAAARHLWRGATLPARRARLRRGARRGGARRRQAGPHL